jgi:hypothetical protein
MGSAHYSGLIPMNGCQDSDDAHARSLDRAASARVPVVPALVLSNL